MDHADSIAPFEDFRRPVVVAPREHVDFIAQRGQMSCDVGYVNVLSTGIHTTSQGRRGSMHLQHMDAGDTIDAVGSERQSGPNVALHILSEDPP